MLMIAFFSDGGKCIITYAILLFFDTDFHHTLSFQWNDLSGYLDFYVLKPGMQQFDIIVLKKEHLSFPR